MLGTVCSVYMATLLQRGFNWPADLTSAEPNTLKSPRNIEVFGPINILMIHHSLRGIWDVMSSKTGT
jgi:hypothetical protein